MQWRAGEPAGGVEDAPFSASWRQAPGVVEQVFTHFTLRLTLYVAEVGAAPPQLEGALWVAPQDAASAGFSSVMLKALTHAGRFVEEANLPVMPAKAGIQSAAAGGER